MIVKYGVGVVCLLSMLKMTTAWGKKLWRWWVVLVLDFPQSGGGMKNEGYMYTSSDTLSDKVFPLPELFPGHHRPF